MYVIQNKKIVGDGKQTNSLIHIYQWQDERPRSVFNI